MTATTPPSPTVGDVITTAGELDGLSPESVVRDGIGSIFVLNSERHSDEREWGVMGLDGPYDTEFVADHLPLTLLYRPDAPPAAPTAGAGREALARLINAEANIVGTYVSYEHAERITDAVLKFLAAPPAPAPVDADAVERVARAVLEAASGSEPIYLVTAGTAPVLARAALAAARAGGGGVVQWGMRYPNGRIVETFDVDPAEQVAAAREMGLDVARVYHERGPWIEVQR